MDSIHNEFAEDIDLEELETRLYSQIYHSTETWETNNDNVLNIVQERHVSTYNIRNNSSNSRYYLLKTLSTPQNIQNKNDQLPDSETGLAVSSEISSNVENNANNKQTVLPTPNDSAVLPKAQSAEKVTKKPSRHRKRKKRSKKKKEDHNLLYKHLQKYIDTQNDVTLHTNILTSFNDTIRVKQKQENPNKTTNIFPVSNPNNDVPTSIENVNNAINFSFTETLAKLQKNERNKNNKGEATTTVVENDAILLSESDDSVIEIPLSPPKIYYVDDSSDEGNNKNEDCLFVQTEEPEKNVECLIISDDSNLEPISASNNNQGSEDNLNEEITNEISGNLKESLQNKEADDLEIDQAELSFTSDSNINDFIEQDIRNMDSSNLSFNFNLHDPELSHASSYNESTSYIDLYETESSCSEICPPSQIKSFFNNESNFNIPSNDLFCEPGMTEFYNFITPLRNNPDVNFVPKITKATKAQNNNPGNKDKNSELSRNSNDSQDFDPIQLSSKKKKKNKKNAKAKKEKSKKKCAIPNQLLTSYLDNTCNINNQEEDKLNSDSETSFDTNKQLKRSLEESNENISSKKGKTGKRKSASNESTVEDNKKRSKKVVTNDSLEKSRQEIEEASDIAFKEINNPKGTEQNISTSEIIKPFEAITDETSANKHENSKTIESIETLKENSSPKNKSNEVNIQTSSLIIAPEKVAEKNSEKSNEINYYSDTYFADDYFDFESEQSSETISSPNQQDSSKEGSPGILKEDNAVQNEKDIINLCFDSEDSNSVEASQIISKNIVLNISETKSDQNKREQVKSGASSEMKSFKDFYTTDMKKFYDDSWGQEDFDHERVQNSMSVDTTKWKLDPSDMYCNRMKRRGPFCIKCRDYGHYQQYCPMVSRPVKCSTCGNVGHAFTNCPNSLCTTCRCKSPLLTTSCRFCVNYRYLVCPICKCFGHEEQFCPDIWRRYFLTIKESSKLNTPTSSFILKPHNQRWCSNCANRGHFDYQCQKWRSDRYSTKPQIFNYTPIYNNNNNNNNSCKTGKASPKPVASLSDVNINDLRNIKNNLIEQNNVRYLNLIKRLKKNCYDNWVMDRLNYFERAIHNGQFYGKKISELYRIQSRIQKEKRYC